MHRRGELVPDVLAELVARVLRTACSMSARKLSSSPSLRATPTMAKRVGQQAPQQQRVQRRHQLLCVRSPDAPKMTSANGSGVRRSDSPSSQRVLLLRRGRHQSGRLHRVAAELVAQRGGDLRREVLLVARGEAREQRGGDHRRRHVLGDRLVRSSSGPRRSPRRTARSARACRRTRRTRRRAARAARSGRRSRSARCRRSRAGRGRTRSAPSPRSPRRTPASARTRSRCAPSSRSGRRRTGRRARSRRRGRAP